MVYFKTERKKGKKARNMEGRKEGRKIGKDKEKYRKEKQTEITTLIPGDKNHGAP